MQRHRTLIIEGGVKAVVLHEHLRWRILWLPMRDHGLSDAYELWMMLF